MYSVYFDNKNMKQFPEILSTRVVAESRLFKIESVHLRFQNGNERNFERMRSSGRGAVMIVPFIADDTIVLVREYAAGTDRYELTFPKGLVDAGETSEAAANRELREEIGYASNSLTKLGTMTAAPSYWGGKADIFMAKNLYASALKGDEPEPLEVVHWKLNDYRRLLQQENFSEARSIAALMLTRDIITCK